MIRLELKLYDKGPLLVDDVDFLMMMMIAPFAVTVVVSDLRQCIEAIESPWQLILQ